VWELDDDPVGFSTADTITFECQARMHLDIVDPDRRRAGIGVRCVRRPAPSHHPPGDSWRQRVVATGSYGGAVSIARSLALFVLAAAVESVPIEHA
jgi:hypothetical protein